MDATVEGRTRLHRYCLIAAGIVFGCLAGVLLIGGPPVEASGGAVTPCGGAGQRACCFLENPSIGACQSGLVEVAGCEGDCRCPDIFGNPSSISSSGTCAVPQAVTPCGGVGQRACCFLENTSIGACQNGLVEVPGCFGDCQCSGIGNSSGMCAATARCGAEGQRACNHLGVAVCDAGLTALPGCSGNCYASSWDSDPAADILGLSAHTCVKLPLEPMLEPTTNAVPAASTCSMSGYADLHLHLFADLAHGGGVLGGAPYDYGTGGGVNEALRPDFTSTKALVKKDGTPQPAPLLCDPAIHVDCSKPFFHGDHDLFAGDSLGAGTHDGAGSNFGAPVFSGWPKWTSTTHQQAYYKWLERAWQGGLRMVTMLAVTNEALCRGSRRVEGVNCEDSMAAVNQQIAAAKAFEQWIAEHHGGWFKIVYSPHEARLAMARGKLAVVLGVETAELFNCKFPMPQCERFSIPSVLAPNQKDYGLLGACTFDPATNDRPLAATGEWPADSSVIPACTPAYIESQVQALYDAGVRHVFPIHNFDNAFGGAATWNSTIEIGNRVVEGHWWKTRECSSEGYGFKLGGVIDTFTQALIAWLGFGQITGLPLKTETASCNDFGLLPLGKVLMRELMKRGMIIDVDHLSTRAFDDTMDMMENPGAWVAGRSAPYPVVATHVLLRELHTDTSLKHERLRTIPQLTRIRNVGGMIAAMLKDDVQDTDNKGKRVTVTSLDPAIVGSATATAFVDDCRHSSKSFAAAYMTLSWVMGRPVAFGSDFNGTAGHFGPRFGSEGCGGNEPIVAHDRRRERAQQYATWGQRVVYPFQVPGFGSFNHQVTGRKVFDFNVDGLAHIGLLPDFVEDLRQVGLTLPGPQGTYHGMLMDSAQEYIRVWERATGATAPPLAEVCAEAAAEGLSVKAIVTPAANAAGWHRTNVSVSWQVTDGSGMPATTGCEPTTLTAETDGTTLTCTATSSTGLTTDSASVSIKIDKTPPVVTAARAASSAANAYGWNNTSVTAMFSAIDTRSGIDGASSADYIVSAEGTNQSRTHTFTDRAGNATTGTLGGIHIDRTPPVILTSGRAPAANANGWNNTDVTATFTAADALSGLTSAPSLSQVVSTEGADQSRTQTFTDLAGNSASATVSGISIDKTGPVVTTGRSPAANGYGWNNTDVTATFSATDGLSGLAGTSPVMHVVTTEGAAQARSATFTDLAGNTTSATVDGISIDKTPPVPGTSGRSPGPNAHGWNNTDVTATFTASDALSGLTTASSLSQVVSTEGANQSRTQTFEDRAGNSISMTVTGISIDTTPPLIVGSPSTSPNGNNWYATAVTVSFDCSDALSGVQSCSAPVTLQTEGTNLSASGTVTDRAGNTASTVVGGINIDLTPPVMSCSARTPSPWPPNGTLSTITTTVGVNGGISGADGFTLLSVVSNEPDNGLGDGNTEADIQGWVIGTASVSGLLRAERSGLSTGRIYTLTYRGLDLAGHAATCTIDVVVPHDLRDK